MQSRHRETLLIMLAALLAIIVRSPLLLLHGRVVAEEGTVYFQQAWDTAAWTAFLAPHQGYYSLFMNGFTLFAERVLPLEWFAVSLVSVSLLVMLLTVYLAISCEIFQGRARWLAAAVVLLVPSIEVWLTAEDMQFYFSACTALICLSSPQGLRTLRSLTLLLAGLTGPVSCIFTPFFWWRAWRSRTPMATLQAAILTLCSLTQAFVILHFHGGGRSPTDPAKLEWFGPFIFLKIFTVAFLGRLAAFLAQRLVIHHPGAAVCLLYWLLAVVSTLFFWRLARMGGHAGRLCFALAMGSLLLDFTAIAETVSSLFIGAFRYVFTGSLLLWLLPLIAYAQADRTGNVRQRKLALSCLCLFLAWGTVDAVGYWTRFQNLTPRWQPQIAAWRRDPATAIHVSPAPWLDTMHLHPH